MNLPIDFIRATKELLGEEWGSFDSALNSSAPTSIRYNNKIEIPTSPSFEKVAWCETAFYLEERPSFTFDPLFHSGVYYVQEASSMFLEQIVKQFVKQQVVALDLCAAPGGKSTHLIDLLPQGSVLISNEINRQRAYILSENIQKWGNDNCIVTNNAPADFERYQGLFDFILVDAPCSGEGMFRKDPNSIDEWSLKNVENCVSRQRDILSKIWGTLKEDGILVYSTCTYNRSENEENIQWLKDTFSAEILSVKCEPKWNIFQNEYGCRFFPHRTKGEGFFISALRKKTFEKTIKLKSLNFPKVNNKELLKYLKKDDQFTIFSLQDILYAVPKDMDILVQNFAKNNTILHAGIEFAQQKGRDFLPQSGLALSKSIDLTQINVCDVDKEIAIRFLQKENISINSEKGFVLISYQNVPLGWVKNLGNRSNNLYPKEWRIRNKQIF
ncbi:MAG: rRNA cytosine-C5-methyltransferase [Paludibacteraceae bacterium]|nr:rRNA cytosine-C5-methyltransferase [Paludibacteraceae bacterium]